MHLRCAALVLVSLARFGLSLPLEATQSDAAISLPPGLATEIGIDPNVVGQTVVEILDDEDDEQNDATTAKRNATPDKSIDRRAPPVVQFKGTAITAADAVKLPAKDGAKLRTGILLRGDSRDYNRIFAEGFKPQGSDTNIDHHLSKQKDSGFVSTTRSVQSAAMYMHGDTANRASVGQIFAIVPNSVPDGYWIPGSAKGQDIAKNQEFAVRGAIPAESIAGVNIISNDPKTPTKWIPNPNSPHAKAGKKDGRIKRNSHFSCFGKKRAMACSIKSSPKIAKVPNQKPKTDGSRKPGNKNPTKGIKVPGPRFLQWLQDVTPEAFHPLADAIADGKISEADCQLGFKRAASKVIRERWSEFGNSEKALESLKNIVVDITMTARTTVPVGFYEDILKALPDIAMEINIAKSPEEKLRIANKDIHPVVQAWSVTPFGILNENMMNASANEVPFVQGAAASVNELWSYTPLGWVVNQVAPIDSLIKMIGF